VGWAGEDLIGLARGGLSLGKPERKRIGPESAEEMEKKGVSIGGALDPTGNHYLAWTQEGI